MTEGHQGAKAIVASSHQSFKGGQPNFIQRLGCAEQIAVLVITNLGQLNELIEGAGDSSVSMIHANSEVFGRVSKC